MAAAVCSIVLALGVLLLFRRSRGNVTLAGGLIVLGAESAFTYLASRGTGFSVTATWQYCKLLGVAMIPAIWLLFSLVYARGNSREFLLKWRWTLIAALVLPLAIAIVFRGNLLTPGSEMNFEGDPLKLDWAGNLLYLFALAASVGVLMNLERTFRASVGTMRWRIKFMLLGIGLIFLVRLYTSSQILIFYEIDASLESLNSVATLVAAVLIIRCLFRAGHFDTDVYPPQTVLQGSLVVLLAGLYLLAVGVFRKIPAFLGGESAFALKALVILVSLVLVAALLQSDRARLHLRRLASRHFQRPLYDYRTVWRKFTEATATRVEQTELCRALVRLTAEMFEALSVTIWVVDDKKETFVLGASTSLSDAEGRELRPTPQAAEEVAAYLRTHADPIEIDTQTTNWAATLRRMQPSEFTTGGSRVCVPLVAHNEVLGVIIVGDRVRGLAFSLQDVDMLKCAADHATASLLNIHLSRKLLQAKELEAFQMMAAFFVHDLKNAASTLGLMLQNLPHHFDDPAFREDALRGMAKTVTHINRVIGQLSLLRNELKIVPVEADFNAMVLDAIAALEKSVNATLLKDIRPLPKLAFDREQILKVVTNLLLNAVEAVARDGQVQITTGKTDGGVVLTVSDNGCGMSPEFLNQSLFRPFKTTKKTGLGIGMFQSKMIVEAHGGKIAVTSEVGKGTNFQVFLPLAANVAAKGMLPAAATGNTH